MKSERDFIKMINICIPTLNRYDLLEKCIDSALSGFYQANMIYIIDNGNNLPEHFYSKYPNFLMVHASGINYGVAKSWNWFLQNVSHPMIICNDDVEFGTYDIEIFTSAYNGNEADFYYPAHMSGNIFSCFMPTPHLIETIGYFDENFYPAYFEDNDYFYRMLINKLYWEPLETETKHSVSSTIKSYSPEEMMKHHKEFNKNKEYYRSKWGGLPGQETYKTPFNK